jgi:hypothetical protein
VEVLTIMSFMHLPLSVIDRVESYRISFVEVSARSVANYVCHVGDNLRIWAERLMGVVEGTPTLVGGCNENELAHARNYESIPLQASMWSVVTSSIGR